MWIFNRNYMYKVVIVGGEKMGNYSFFEQKVITYIKVRAKNEGVILFTVGDKFIDKFAEKFHITTKTFYTDWASFGKDALKERNIEMLNEADAVIIFEDELKDTHMIQKMATERGLPLRYVTLP